MRTEQAILAPIKPGEIIQEDFLKPLGISINQLSRDLSVPLNGISEIVNGKRAITADTALRLERYFGIEAAKGGHYLSVSKYRISYL